MNTTFHSLNSPIILNLSWPACTQTELMCAGIAPLLTCQQHTYTSVQDANREVTSIPLVPIVLSSGVTLAADEYLTSHRLS